jgi:hypothetical protein
VYWFVAFRVHGQRMLISHTEVAHYECDRGFLTADAGFTWLLEPPQACGGIQLGRRRIAILRLSPGGVAFARGVILLLYEEPGSVGAMVAGPGGGPGQPPSDWMSQCATMTATSSRLTRRDHLCGAVQEVAAPASR